MGFQTRKSYPRYDDHSNVLMNGDNREAGLTTIVITRGLVDLLNRALFSLDSQRSVHLRLIVIVDDCPVTCEFLTTLPRPSGAVVSVECTNVKRGTYDNSGLHIWQPSVTADPIRLELGVAVILTTTMSWNHGISSPSLRP